MHVAFVGDHWSDIDDESDITILNVVNRVVVVIPRRIGAVEEGSAYADRHAAAHDGLILFAVQRVNLRAREQLRIAFGLQETKLGQRQPDERS